MVASVQEGLSTWWAPALAFAAGILSFASPCVLPLVPAYASLVSGTAGIERGEARARLGPMVLFVAGFSAVFTSLGAFAGTLVPLVQSAVGLRVVGAVIVVLGALMLLYAAQVRWPGLYREARPFLGRLGSGRATAFPLGMAFAAGWTPCVGPVLGGILAIASGQGGAVRGAGLLLAYSLGLGVPFLLLGAGIGLLLRAFERVKRHYHWVIAASGGVMVTLGVLLLTGL